MNKMTRAVALVMVVVLVAAMLASMIVPYML